MSRINYDIALYRSPYYENLIEELYRISSQKRNIYKKIKTEHDYRTKLSFEEKGILSHLSDRENKILFEILTHKDWFAQNDLFINSLKQKLGIKPNTNDREELNYHPVNLF